MANDTNLVLSATVAAQAWRPAEVAGTPPELPTSAPAADQGRRAGSLSSPLLVATAPEGATEDGAKDPVENTLASWRCHPRNHERRQDGERLLVTFKTDARSAADVQGLLAKGQEKTTKSMESRQRMERSNSYY